MSESKLKVIEWNRQLFPDLADSLEKNGQVEDVLRDEKGITVDGIKREILLGKEQVRVRNVPNNSATSNIHHLSKMQRKAITKYQYEQLTTVYPSMEAKNIISKQYGISLRTVERDLNPNVAPNVAISKPKVKSRKYKDTATWNPFVGCEFDCTYCKPSFQQNHYYLMQHQKCGGYRPHLHEDRLDPSKIPNEKTIFVCGDSDISFCYDNDIFRIIEIMKADKRQGRIWFIQSKNPKCLQQFVQYLPKNTILLTTLETNRDSNYEKISNAPPPSMRAKDFASLEWTNKIVTIEPILDFDLDEFVKSILAIKPIAVFIGYNSHPKAIALNEPDMEKTLDLIVALKNYGIRVLTKELRKMAYRDFIPERQ
jgi:hypothetical protein